MNEIAIRNAMIDAAGIARMGGWETKPEALAIIAGLAPLVGGWLPEAVEIIDGKVVVKPRQ